MYTKYVKYMSSICPIFLLAIDVSADFFYCFIKIIVISIKPNSIELMFKESILSFSIMSGIFFYFIYSSI